MEKQIRVSRIVPKIDLEKFSQYDDTYEIVDNLDDGKSTVPIRLTDERYNGTIIRYNTISVKEIDEKDEATLKFDFDFVENPHELTENNIHFNDHIGGILVHIIITALNEKEENEAGNTDTESSHSQRELFEESSSIS